MFFFFFLTPRAIELRRGEKSDTIAKFNKSKKYKTLMKDKIYI